MSYQTILFDLDGTVIDSAPGVTRSFSYALAAYGIDVDPSELYKVVGPPLHESFMNFYGFSRDDAFKAVEKYREYYRGRGIFECRAYDGIVEMIKKLHESGRELLIASSKPTVFVNMILERLGIFDCFDFVSGSELDGRRTDKTEVVDYALANMRGDKGNAVMIGDRSFDIVGAHAKGLPAIGVAWGYATAGELDDAEFIVRSAHELESILL